MARLPRYFVPGLPLHVIQRGNNREPIFAGEDDYRFYLAPRTGSGLSLKHGARGGIIESMARPLRIEFGGALYHVTARGDRREPIYEDDEDRRIFLQTLAGVVERFNWVCHAHCLMTNHYHLVIETPDGNLSKGMRQLNGVFTGLHMVSVGRIVRGSMKDNGS